MSVRSDTLDPATAIAARTASAASLHVAHSLGADVSSIVGRAHDLNVRNGFAEDLERSMRRR